MKSERIVVARAGGPEKLRLVSCTLPALGAHDVRVRIDAAGVAFADIMVREGRYPGVPMPATPGYDLVGHVEAIGEEVRGIRIGQRVAALTVTGAYARHAVIPAAWAAPISDVLDAPTAVALILNYVTAWQMLFRNTALEAGDAALVHGGAGGVGTALLELCREQGIVAFATVSEKKRGLVQELGAKPIDYVREDFVARVRAETKGGGADAAFDHLGGVHLKRSYAALRASGVLVSYGGLAAFRGGRSSLLAGAGMLLGQPRFAPLQLLLANKNIVGFDIAGRRAARPDWFAKDLGDVFALAERGRLSPLIDVVMPLAAAADAHRRLASGVVRGKIVLDCQ